MNYSCASKNRFGEFLFHSLFNTHYRASRPLHGYIAWIIRDLRQTPTKNPLCILWAGVDTTTRGGLSIIVMPVGRVNCNACSDK